MTSKPHTYHCFLSSMDKSKLNSMLLGIHTCIITITSILFRLDYQQKKAVHIREIAELLVRANHPKVVLLESASVDYRFSKRARACASPSNRAVKQHLQCHISEVAGEMRFCISLEDSIMPKE